MTQQELGRIFQVEHHDEVPDYELVTIHHRRQKRSLDDVDQIHQIGLDAFGQRYELELNRNLNLVPSHRPLDVFYADNSTEDIKYEPSYEDEVGQVYQDEENMAALVLFKPSGEEHYQMDGTIGPDLVVKPAPARLKAFAEPENDFFEKPFWKYETQGRNGSNELGREEKELPVDYAFLDEDEEYEYNDIDSDHFTFVRPKKRRKKRELVDCGDVCVNTGVHIVYKRKDVTTEHDSDYSVMETDKLPYIQTSTSKRHSRQKRQAPFMIFPEILVIVDYDGYRLHGEDNVAIKRYVISFWNGVDLRYKLLKGPSVKISIAGIIISRGRDATPYLERNRVGRDAIDAASALTDMGKYLFLERRLPVYDIAVAITKLDMCRRKTRHGDCNRGTAGFAYVGGACVVNKRLEKVNSVAIVEDTGGFSGIIVAAHELGHL